MNDLRTDSCRWRAACLLAALSLLTACPLWAAAWPTPDFDHGRTRHNVDETGLALPLSALWSTDPAQWTVSHDPILAAGLVYSYCAPPETEVKDGSLCAFDQASGTIVWRRTVREIFGEFPAPPYAWLFLSELTWSGDRLFLVLNDKRGDRGTSFLKALDGGDGATIWSQEIDWQEIQPRDEPMLNAPIVVDGDVFVVSDIGRIFSFDAGGGSLNWSRLSDEYRGCRQSLMLQGRLLQTCWAFTAAYDPGSGAELWRKIAIDVVSGLASAHDASDRMISVTRNYGDAETLIEAHRGSNGNLAWSRTCAGGATHPVISTDRIEVLCVADDASTATLLALDPSSGDPISELPVDWPAGYPVLGKDLIKADGVLFVTGQVSSGPYAPGTVLALSPATGDVLWSGDTAVRQQSLALAGGTLVAGGIDRLAVFGGGTAQPFQHLSVAFSTPVVRRSAEGWYTEATNPLTVSVTASCPADAGADCKEHFGLHVFSSAGKVRFYHDETDEVEGALCASETSGEDYSHKAMVAFCRSPGATRLEVPPGDSRELLFKLWVQPSEASDLRVTASWMGDADEDVTQIERADIQPVVFLHGILGSMPPQNRFITDQDTMVRTIDPFLRSYYPLLVNLQKMGYRWNETLFAVAYDWRRSNRLSAGFLHARLSEVEDQAQTVPYVAAPVQADVIAHSMGGLVTRAFVQGEALDPEGEAIEYQSELRKVIFIASPHHGFPADYRTREGMTWSDYLYDGPWQKTLRLIMDNRVWPTLVAKGYGPDQSELEASCVFVPQDPANPSLPLLGTLPGVQGNQVGEYFCPPDVLKTWSDHLERGAVSLREMLPTDDPHVFPQAYLQASGVLFPYGREYNVFLEGLNASISELVSQIGLENLYVLYGDGAVETDHWYNVEPPDLPFWTHGEAKPQGVVNAALGDDLIPRASLSMEWLVDLPEDQREKLDAALPAADGGARHKEIVYHEDVQSEWVPRFLTGTAVPFDTPHPGLPSPTGALTVLTACPVHLLVIDPAGRRTGYDPATGILYDEIPDAIYTEPGQEPELIVIPEPLFGDYEIRSAGYGDGMYLVRVDYTTAETTRALGSRAGSIVADQVETFSVELADIPDNQPPEAAIVPLSPILGPAPLTVVLDGSSSFDPDGSIVDWSWDLGDGSTAAGALVEHTYPVAGSRTATLTVTDDEDATATASLGITATGQYSVLFVVAPDAGGLQPGDQAVADHLQAAGAAVDWRAAGTVQASDAAGFDLVLISSTPSSSAIGATFRDVPVPVATWEPFLLDDMAMTGPVANLDYGPEIGRTTIEVEPDNPIAPGFSGPVTVASTPSKMTYGRPAPHAIGIARSQRWFERLHLFAYDTGDAMVGRTAPARRLALFLSDDTPAALTADGWALVDAALCWAVNCGGDAVARFTAAPAAPGSLTFDFDGTVSETGAGAAIVDWRWQIEGTVVTGGAGVADAVTYTFQQAGPQLVELTVTDSEGRSHTRGAWVQAGAPARRALLVVGSVSLGAGDHPIHEMLQGLGFAVELAGHREARAAGAGGMDLVVISSTVVSELVDAGFRDLGVPILTWEGWLFDDLGLTGAEPYVDFNRDPGLTGADFVAPGHPVANGYSGFVTLYRQGDGLLWGMPDLAATVIATSTVSASHAAIFVYEAGDDMVGLTAPARRVALPYSDVGPMLLNAGGWLQFEAAVRWAAGL